MLLQPSLLSSISNPWIFQRKITSFQLPYPSQGAPFPAAMAPYSAHPPPHTHTHTHTHFQGAPFPATMAPYSAHPHNTHTHTHTPPMTSLTHLLPKDKMSPNSVLRCSVMSDSLRPHGLQPARLLCPWDSPGKNTGVGGHALLQGIFPT